MFYTGFIHQPLLVHSQRVIHLYFMPVSYICGTRIWIRWAWFVYWFYHVFVKRSAVQLTRIWYIFNTNVQVIFVRCLWFQLNSCNGFALAGLFYSPLVVFENINQAHLERRRQRSLLAGLWYAILHSVLKASRAFWLMYLIRPDGCVSLSHHKWQLRWQSVVTNEGMSYIYHGS